VRGILFDFGGTLDGPGLPWADRFAILYREAGIDVADRLRAATGYGTRQAYQMRQVAGLNLRETVVFHVKYQFEYLTIDNPSAAEKIVSGFVMAATTALAESRAILERLARRFKLGVVSNFYGNLGRVLSDAGIDPLLSVIVDSTVVGISKPDCSIFTLAVATLGAHPADVLMVGDSLEQDIAPARAAGLRTAWLAAGRVSPDPLPADLRLATLGELDDVLV
jgi:putative hydrolase of the HAD superfamily